jgi:hypothetical protein
MTRKRWNEIREVFELGDPLKDIGCDDDELIAYIFDLRVRLNLEIDQP